MTEAVASSARELSRQLREPAPLAQFRARAEEVYRATLPPKRATHLWRYTDPAEFEPHVDPFLAESGGTVRLELPPAIEGVEIYSLAQPVGATGDSIVSMLGSLAGPEYGRFEALNAAAFRNGVVVHIARGVTVAEPIVLRTVLGAGAFEATRLLVVIEDGVSATLIDDLCGGLDDRAQRFSQVTEVVVGRNCQVHFVTAQHLGRRVVSHRTHQARLGAGSTYRPILASFGGGLSKLDIGVHLDGEGSESEMAGFLCGIDRQQFDHHTTHHHVGAHTRSNLDFRTVLTGRARSAYTGLIRIESQARFSEAYQENRNLLLSDQCRAESIPELEILTQEVMCKHGATVGPVDPAQLFYLRSRGLTPAEAVRLIVAGHFDGVLARMPESLRESLHALLLERLQQI